MRQLLQCKVIRSVCFTLILAMVVTFIPPRLGGTPAHAQLMPQYAVAVTDIINQSGVYGDMLARQATDAIVVEMSKTSAYNGSIGITRKMINDAMGKLDVRPPLDKVNIVRLGEELNADAILEGVIKSVRIEGNGPTRRASVSLMVQLVDQASGEVINGAVQTGTSSSRVGYSADDEALVTEAVSKAAFQVVKTMVDYVIPVATIQMNIGSDQVMLNRGVRDGIKPGMRMIVIRGREIIGYIEVREVNPTDSVAKVVKSMRGIQPEDKAKAIYEMPALGTGAVKSEPLSSGAPPRAKRGSNALQKIGTFLLYAAAIYGLYTLIRPGRGTEDAPKIGTLGPMEITWDPSKYGHGVNVMEYQILQDPEKNSTIPVKVMRDPTAIDLGKISLASLFGGGAAITFPYYSLATNPAASFSTLQATVTPEAYGVTHQYMVRVLYKVTPAVAGTGTTNGGGGTGGGTTDAGGSVSYQFTPVSNIITMTAIDPVRITDVVAPRYDSTVGPSSLLVSDLEDTTVDMFIWNSKAGADVYYISVEPVQPGAAPPFKSDAIYATGPVVKLPDSERKRLASTISSYAGTVMRWRVYCRHKDDTSQAWFEGDENLFQVVGVPPGQPK